jgi:hypothetical protein
MLIFRTLFCAGGGFDVRRNLIRLYVTLLNMDNSELDRDDSTGFHSATLILKAFRGLPFVAIVVGQALAMTLLVPPLRTVCYTRNVPTTSNAGYTVSSPPEAIMLYLLGSPHSLEPHSKVLQTPPDLSVVFFR